MDTSEKYNETNDDRMVEVFLETLRRLKYKESGINEEYTAYEVLPKSKLKDTELAVLRKVER